MRKFLLLFPLLFAGTTQAQWVDMISNSTESIEEIQFPSEQTGYFVTATFAAGGKIYGTEDGQNWTLLHSDPSNYFLSVFFLNEETGWVGGGDIGSGIILHTDDGGVNWTTQTGTCEQIESIYFVDTNNGWAVANDGTSGVYYIYHTTDGGAHWATQKTGFDYVRSVWFTTPLNGFVAGDNGRIFGTTDGGSNWNLLNTGVIFHFNDIQFLTPAHGWACGSYVDGGIYETTDSGSTWHSILNIPSSPINSIAFVTSTMGFASEGMGRIRMTTDGGVTWNLTSTNTTNSVNSLSFPDSTVGYSGCGNGEAMRWGSLPNSTGSNLENVFSVYPNPATDICYVSVDNRFSYSEFSLIDLSGREIKKLPCVSGVITVRDIKPGVYFIIGIGPVSGIAARLIID